jgi:hypothetical protein
MSKTARELRTNPPLFTVESAPTGGGLVDYAQVQGPEGATYEIQFYSSPTSNPEFKAAHYVGSATVTVNSNGFFNAQLQGPADGDVYTLMTVTDSAGDTSEFSVSAINGAHLDQGKHLEGGETQTASANTHVITAGKTFVATDTITPNNAAGSSAARIGPEAAKTVKSKTKITPTGAVYFDDGDTVIAQARVKVVRGVAKAQAKLKLTTLGTQTIFVVYQPDAKGLAHGLTPDFSSFTVTVDPATKTRHGHGKARDVVAKTRVASLARELPAGPRSLVGHPSGQRRT